MLGSLLMWKDKEWQSPHVGRLVPPESNDLPAAICLSFYPSVLLNSGPHKAPCLPPPQLQPISLLHSKSPSNLGQLFCVISWRHFDPDGLKGWRVQEAVEGGGERRWAFSLFLSAQDSRS